jgi:hypothetical protein
VENVDGSGYCLFPNSLPNCCNSYFVIICVKILNLNFSVKQKLVYFAKFILYVGANSFLK